MEWSSERIVRRTVYCIAMALFVWSVMRTPH